MPHTKATDVLVIRQILHERGAALEQAFHAGLTPETQAQYRAWIPTEWISLEAETEVLRTAGATLYPEDAQGVRRLGEEVAKRMFSSTYRVFLKTPTAEFFLKRFPTVWRTLYDHGTAGVEKASPHRADLVVKSFPELSALERDYLTGCWAGIFRLAIAKSVTVFHEDHFPMEWRWEVRWQ